MIQHHSDYKMVAFVGFFFHRSEGGKAALEPGAISVVTFHRMTGCFAKCFSPQRQGIMSFIKLLNLPLFALFSSCSNFQTSHRAAVGALTEFLLCLTVLCQTVLTSLLPSKLSDGISSDNLKKDLFLELL